jgi:hypothetical protein
MQDGDEAASNYKKEGGSDDSGTTYEEVALDR